MCDMFGEKVGGNKGELITRLEPHMSKAAVQRFNEYQRARLKVRVQLVSRARFPGSVRAHALPAIVHSASPSPRSAPRSGPCLHDLTASALALPIVRCADRGSA